MDVIGRAPAAVFSFRDTGPHPTPYLRLLISAEMLRRMGFEKEAEQYARAWKRIYPNPHAGHDSEESSGHVSQSVPAGVRHHVLPALPVAGEQELPSQVIRFSKKDQKMIEEGARRLAAGNDPGILPERYLIGAARHAPGQGGLARPGVITENFYKELVRR